MSGLLLLRLCLFALEVSTEGLPVLFVEVVPGTKMTLFTLFRLSRRFGVKEQKGQGYSEPVNKRSSKDLETYILVQSGPEWSWGEF